MQAACLVDGDNVLLQGHSCPSRADSDDVVDDAQKVCGAARDGVCPDTVFLRVSRSAWNMLSGSRIQGSGFRLCDSSVKVQVQDSGFRVQAL